MKLQINKYYQVIAIMVSVSWILVSCGGQQNDSAIFNTSGVHSTSSNSSGMSPIQKEASNTEPAITSVNGSTSFLPTFGVAQLSDGKNEVVGSSNALPQDATDLANYSQKAAQEAVVTGFIVKYKDGTSTTVANLQNAKVSAQGNSNGAISPTAMASSLSQVTASYGLSLKFRANAVGNATALSSSKMLTLNEAQKIAVSLKASNPNIVYVDPDIRLQKTVLVPPVDDTSLANQWSLLADPTGYTSNVLPAWSVSTGANVVVAVVDTGITPHQDLVDNTLPGVDTISTPWIANDSNNLSTTADVATRDNDATDPGDSCSFAANTWHGSHVAGIIAAKANNSKGIAGIAYNAKILPVRVLGRCGGDLSDVAAGIVWAVGGHVDGVLDNISANKAKIINLSLGAAVNTCLPTMKYAIDYARAQGAIVVVAAGNEGKNAQYSFPANCAAAITVGSTGTTGNRSSFSNFGPLVDISAPGEAILSTVDSQAYSASVSPNAYVEMSGTSMAAPHVSGVLALMFAYQPNLTLEQAETALKLNTRAFMNTGLMAYGGVGIVNAAGVMNALSNPNAFESRVNFNADAKSDLLWRHNAGNFTQISLMGNNTVATSDAVFSSSVFKPSAVDIPIVLADFNSDSKTDIVWKKPAQNNYRVFVSYMDGNSNNYAELLPKVISNAYSVVSAANFDRAAPNYSDGRSDLYFRNNTNGDGFYCFSNNFNNISFLCSANFSLAKGLNWLASADFNADGYVDMLFRNPKTGTLYIAYNNSRMTVLSEIGTLPLSEVLMGVGDYDADSKADLLFRNTSTSFVSVASNPGSNYLNLSTSVSGVPSYKTILKSGDYNGDGKDDMVLRDNLTGVLSLIEITLASDLIEFSTPVKLGVVQNMFSAVF